VNVSPVKRGIASPKGGTLILGKTTGLCNTTKEQDAGVKKAPPGTRDEPTRGNRIPPGRTWRRSSWEVWELLWGGFGAPGGGNRARGVKSEVACAGKKRPDIRGGGE